MKNEKDDIKIIIEDFVDFVYSKDRKPSDWKENVCFMALQITNNSANDYYRQPKWDEMNNLIDLYLEKYDLDD